MLKELAAWICTRVAGLTLGANVQFGFRAQDAPVRCHTLLDSGGPSDFDLPYRKDKMLQIATRGETIEQAHDDAWTIYDAIHGTSGWVIGPLVSGGQTYKIWSITGQAKPQYLGQDEKGGFEYSTNYLLLMSPV